MRRSIRTPADDAGLGEMASFFDRLRDARNIASAEKLQDFVNQWEVFGPKFSEVLTVAAKNNRTHAAGYNVFRVLGIA
jgi:hypothetical protein